MAERHLAMNIQGQITINDDVAEILAHMASYDFADYFVEKCQGEQGRYTKHQIKKTMENVYREVHDILTAKRVARDAVVEFYRKAGDTGSLT